MALTLNSKNGIISFAVTIILSVALIQVITSLTASAETKGIVSTMVNLIPVFVVLGLILMALRYIEQIKERGREFVDNERWKYPPGRR